MTIEFNSIPAAIRTPGVFAEIDNSRALKSLAANPHKALILGQKISAGSIGTDTLVAITNDNLADGFFGPGSILARMCNRFKAANPNTELYAMALSIPTGASAASGDINFTGSASGAGTVFLLVGGVKVYTPVASGWSGADIASAVRSDINGNSNLCMTASINTSTDRMTLLAVGSGEAGTHFDFRVNYHEGQSNPVGITMSLTGMAGGGAVNPDLGDAWPIIDNEHFNHIISPYTDSGNMTELADELATRFGPLVDKQGHGYVAYEGAAASCTTFGNSQNSPHVQAFGVNDSPSNPEDWAAVGGAIVAANLEDDPARPLHFLKLPGILPPPSASRFTQSERNILLFDGVSTFLVDTMGNVLIERLITTYQTNALGLADYSYLDLNTMATLAEIRYQYKVRMSNRFIIPRFKLADDTFPVQPGQKVATPKTVKQEIISLFTLLRDNGLIENLDDFIDNLVVERDGTDVNRVNALLAPDLINQFRVLAGLIQFIL